jgi:AcrR family transcriptional regulator
MSELLSRQRQKRENAIIKAAKELISDKGYRNTSIEEIAEKAEVGPATVYNYFTSKSGLFLSVFNKETETLLKNGEEIIENPLDRVEDTVYRFVEACFGDFINRYSKQLMREVFVAVLIEQLSVRKQIMGMDYALMAQLGNYLETARERGQIRQDLNTADVTFVIYSLIMTDLTAFFVDDDMTVQDFLDAVKRHLSIAFKGFSV